MRLNGAAEAGTPVRCLILGQDRRWDRDGVVDPITSNRMNRFVPIREPPAICEFKLSIIGNAAVARDVNHVEAKGPRIDDHGHLSV